MRRRRGEDEEPFVMSIGGHQVPVVVGRRECRRLRARVAYRVARTAAIARDNRRCTICGTGPGRPGELWLEAHHLVPLWAGGDPFALENITTVCNVCHPPADAESRAALIARLEEAA